MDDKSPRQIYGGHPQFIDHTVAKRSILENHGVSNRMVWSAVFAESYQDTPEQLASRIYHGVKNEYFNTDPIPIEEFKARGYDEHVFWQSDLSYDEAERLYNRKIEKLANEYVISRGKGGAVENIGKFVAAIAPSLLSPVDLALSCVPIAGQARWLALAAKIGRLAKPAQFAASSAVFQAGMEPFIAIAKAYEQEKHTLGEAATNIAVAAGFGGVLGGIAEGVGALRKNFVMTKNTHTPDHVIARMLAEENKELNLDNPQSAKSKYDLKVIAKEDSEWRVPDVKQHVEELREKLGIDNDDFSGDLLAERDHYLNKICHDKILNEVLSGKNPNVMLSHLLKQVNLQQKSNVNEFLSGFVADLKKADLLDQFSAKAYERDFARALRSEAVENQKAVELARITRKWQSYMMNRLNRHGAHLNPIYGYITRQSHNASKLRKVGFEEWHKDVFSKLDLERTGDIDLRQVWENCATKLHPDSVMDTVGSGTSVSNRVSAERKLHFKSADDWMDYNDKYGNLNLKDSVVSEFERLGSSLGLLETMGSNPELMLKNLIEEAKGAIQKKATTDKDTFNQLEKLKRSRKYNQILDMLLGHDSPENVNVAYIGQSLRNIKNMSALGKVVISSFPDLASVNTELGRNAIPVMKRFETILGGIFHGLKSKEKKEFAETMGVYTDHLIGGNYSRLNPEQPIPGKITQMTNTFFKLNFLRWWDRSHKHAVALTLSNHLAKHVYLDFDKLPKTLQKQLVNYDINDSNWHRYREMVKVVEGKKYLVAESEFHAANAILDQNENDALRANLRRYLLDRVDTAIATPHAAEKHLAFFGTKAGTGLGEAVRFMMQFKTFPITFILRPLKAATIDNIPLIERQGNWKDVINSFKHAGTFSQSVQLFVGASALGYISICANQWLKGEEMPELNQKTIEAAMLKGGGLGLFGDFLFQDYSRYGRPFLQEIQGPIISDISEIAKIYSKAKNGELDKAEEDAIKLAFNNIPGRNLFYVDAILNHKENLI